MTIKGPYGFIGGLNTKCGPYDCPDDQFVDGQNCEYKFGELVKRSGNALFSDVHPAGSGKAILGMGTFLGEFLVAYADTKVAYKLINGVIGSWVDITGAVTFNTNGGSCTTTTINGLIILNGNLVGQAGSSNAPVKWTGTGNIALLGGSPQVGAACMTSVNNILFLASTYSNPGRVWWSNPGDPETWPSANFVDVKADSLTNPIYAIFPFGEDLIIFKNRIIARFYTNQLSGSLGPLIIINENIGCAGPQCVDRLPDGRIVFVGFNLHVYIYDGNTFTDISDQPYPNSNIQSIFNSFIPGSFETGSVCVYKAKGQIWISHPGSWTNALGTNFSAGVILIYDYINNCWIPPYPDRLAYKIIEVDYFNPPSTQAHYLLSSSKSNIIQEDTGDVNSDPNAASTSLDAYVTKSINVGGPDSRSFVPRSIYFPIKSGNLTATVYTGANGNNNPTSSSSISISGSSLERKKVTLVKSPSSVFNTLQFRFDGALSNQPFILSPLYVSDEIEAQI